MKSSVWGRGAIKDSFSLPSPFPFLVAMIALLVAIALGQFNAYVSVAVAGALVMAIIIILRQDQLAVTILLAIHIYLDWYVGLYFVVPIMAPVMLLIFLLARSGRHPWVEPQALWLWVLFLVTAIFPMTLGLNLHDSQTYYIIVILSALSIFWLGTLVGREVTSIRRLYKMLAIFGILMAIHTIIQALTGIILFKVSRSDAYLAQLSYFELTGTGLRRVEAFFLSPDTNATFFAMMFFIPLGLFVHSSSLLKKFLYLASALIMLPALLFTYSTASWLSNLVGGLCFIAFVGRSRYRILIPLFALIAGLVIIVCFPAQVNAQFQHFGASYEWPLRVGGWLTALNVIRAFPWTGIGLGSSVYIVRSDPYRVPEQFIPLPHPHNSFLELAALGGLPLLIVFLVILSFTLWQAWRNWSLADARTRSLLGGGLAAVLTLSVNSLVSGGWTIAPLAALGWLVLGAISSPLLTRNLRGDMLRENNEKSL